MMYEKEEANPSPSPSTIRRSHLHHGLFLLHLRFLSATLKKARRTQKRSARMGYIASDAFPETVKDAGIKKLFEDYMNLSNSPNSSHAGDPDEKAFAGLFVEDGTYELASKNAKGHEG